MSIPVLYRDASYIAVHKPAGLLVHRTSISRDRVFLLQQLRNQIGQHVFPVHRLDRATSGVIVFALHADAARELVGCFERRDVDKEYWALVRGWTDAQGVIDHPVTDDEGRQRPQPALTRYRRLQTVELPAAVDRYPTARYSLLSVTPETGRRQQIRKHLKHISHHLIGDTTHGNGRHNRFFRENYAVHRLLLTAYRLGFTQPYTGERVEVRAGPEVEWQRLHEAFGWPWQG